MYNLLKKELTIIISSGQLLITGLSFLIITGLILWVFPGSYNIFENGYSGLYSFFMLTPALFMIFIPVLTMRTFAEEKKSGTAELLFTYPVSMIRIILSKFFAVSFIVLILLLSTSFYWICIYFLGTNTGNMEWGVLISGYIGLFLTAFTFISIGIFTSSFTKNQLIAFILSVFICVCFYWGINLVIPLIPDPKTQLFIQQISLPFHLNNLINGIISLKDICYFIFLIFLFFCLTLFFSAKPKGFHSFFTFFFSGIGIIIGLFALAFLFNLRVDTTSDKRYSLSEYTKRLLKNNTDFLHITIYLDGDLNADFLRLQQETVNIIKELNYYSSNPVTYSFYNPNQGINESTRMKQRNRLLHRNMNDEILTETDNKGVITQKSVFPWADIIRENDTLAISLLSNTTGKTIPERINSSIAELEFKFSEGIASLSQENAGEIAFLEGHGEIPDIYVYDIVEELSNYYHIYRGSFTEELKEIPPYQVLIIAGPEKKFTEKEKFLLDQYLINGGNILLLINSATVSYESLQQEGKSASIVNDVNLNDLLFSYGVRVNPVLLQDLQCASIPLKTGNDNTYHYAPWYYAPLLNPASSHPVTSGISLVKSEFTGSIDFVNSDKKIKKHILLTSSAYTHIVSVPEIIMAEDPSIKETREYFNKSYVPAAVLLEGVFTSAFKNRIPPEGISKTTTVPKPGKIIVAASGSMIRNEIQWTNDNNGIPLPLGYDRYMDIQFGNKSFIMNAVNYLAGNEERLLLRNKQTHLRMLDKTRIHKERLYWQYFNIGLPVIFLLGIILSFNYWRRKKFGE
ncbi:MAG: gliding motility-associated ABC transporter substrate-binding protein GldG [Candidatus Azobacteroides sp.]|nr:gliding motility-associated ABC transporter substrate-binding protein GldG [Candidatus Azobacteroides sp.]